MSLEVRLGRAVPIPLAVVRRRARPSELSTVVPQGCGVVWEFIRARQLPAGRNVAVYLNGEIQLEVGVELATAFAEEGEIVRSSTPAGLAASATHFGPYQELDVAHEAIRVWCQAHGYKLAGPNWEIYGHWQSEWTTDASKIRTDVFYQVTPNHPRMYPPGA
jgi:effector-binding domain-containing protein